ncbi:unnamed protein product [Toxocara canis]|uniref:N-acetyltransferase domain-containing protein n=1 Tax=Toxocara canis TaxID=6265 RepID=A0A183VAY7_TOXCA|nr:unnamed protein product [Toxocara canis]
MSVIFAQSTRTQLAVREANKFGSCRVEREELPMDRVKHEEKENVGVNCEEKQGHARAVCEASEFNDETMERIVLRAELTAKMSDELGSLNFLSNGSGGRYDDTLSYHVISNRCQLDPNQCELKLIWLLQLSNMFSAHLPAMNTEYITRVVFDERHRSLIIVKNRREVIAGACFRLFPKRGFSELAFFAVSHDEQLKGYGKRLMALLQDYHTSECHVYHILTYADKTATRFFKKQGFSANIKLDKERYDGYIRHYKYAIFMDCQLDPSIVYSLLNENGETLKKLYKCAVEELIVDHNRLYEGINEGQRLSFIVRFRIWVPDRLFKSFSMRF